ncbi:MAG: EAL domain-containing protein [Phyllobacteriaceae bacterium]|nr:EAL domain-containing protein [Phyllobacteriaceae bacterium]
MRRFADLFIAICIPIVAGCAGAIAHWQFAASAAATTEIVAAVFLGLAGARWATVRRRRTAEDAERIGTLGRRLGEVTADVTALERRLTALEDGGPRGRRDELDQMVAEIEVIGTLTRQVIEAVADLEVQLTETRGALIGRDGAGTPAAMRAPVTETARPAARGGARSPLVPERFAHLDEEAFLALVRRAIDADRIDLHLQPIVALPQRKVRFYEALTRLRDESGGPIHPSDYIPIAENRGLMAALDEQILLKSVAILRRLAERSREVGVFLNLSSASLAHPGFFRDFLAFMEKNRDLSDMLVLEFPQASVRAMGPIEQEGMRALKDLGFRFSIDQVGDLKISFQNLADRGFRWAKISADRLLHRADELGTDIHPVDLTDYFRRFGMELIADHIEREAEVIDVLDYGVRLGQGNLFAPPRPIKVDATAVERSSGGALARAAAATPMPAPTPAPSEPAKAEPAKAAPAGEPRGEPARAVTRPLAGGTGARKPTPTRSTPAAEEAPPRPGIRIVPGTGVR